MKDFTTRMASLTLAFGFFFITACSSQLNTLEDARQLHDRSNFERALTTVNNLLEEDPGNGHLLFFKADLLKILAFEQQEPVNRQPYYREMRGTLDEIAASEEPELLASRDSLILETWKREKNAAANIQTYAEPDSGSDHLPLIAHYENALTVNPDSSSTYNLTAAAYYQNNDLANAISTLLEAEVRFDPMPLEMEEKLAFLLLEEGQLERSIELYQSMLERNPDREEIRHGLVNAYILDGRHEKSIELLNELLEVDPDNYLYHQSLATELFFYIQSSVAGMIAGNLDDREIIDRHENLMKDLAKAEDHYQFVQDIHPNPDEFTFITAAFYKNTASHLMTLADTRNSNLSDRLYDKAHELLNRSVPVWKAVAERNPENPDIWRSMYQIYSKLDMSEEADEALLNTH